MLDYSISELMQERVMPVPPNSLILLNENSFFCVDNKIYFKPDSAYATIDGENYRISLDAIPIRKIEQDQSLDEIAEALVVERPNNKYVKVSSIDRSISWWISNNAKSLEYPDSVTFEYTSSDSKPRKMVFERVSKAKWELSRIMSENYENQNPAPSASVGLTYKSIMEKLFNENV